MNEDEIKEYIISNLKIDIKTDRDFHTGEYKTLKLIFLDEVISEVYL